MKEVTRYKAAAIQFEPTLMDKENNIGKLKGLCVKAASEGARLIVLPEMATTGYCFYDRDEVSPLVEPIPGPTTHEFQSIAQRYNAYILVGLPEVDEATGLFYNSAALISPAGVVGKYRKTHPFMADIKWAKDGDVGLPVFETELGRIGCLICMDLYFPEPSRIMTLKGADVILNATNWCNEKCPAAAWATRGWENGVYVISSDRWGEERGIQFSGGSSIISPEGAVESYMDAGDGIVYGEIDLQAARQTREERLATRVPENYHSLSLSTYLFNPYQFHRLYGHQPLPPGKKSLIGVGQFQPEKQNTSANLKKIEAFARKARDSGMELLVLPELALEGTIAGPDEALRCAISLPGDPVAQELASMASRYHLVMVLGVVEKQDHDLFNTIIAVGEGGLLGKYRKIHLNPGEKTWATRGDLGFQWVDTTVGRLGLLTGDDSCLPESCMSLALWAADIICIPSCIKGPEPLPFKATSLPLCPAHTSDDSQHWHLWRTRACETSTYVAFANQGGPGGMGFSGLFGPTDVPRNEEVAVDGNDALLGLQVDTGEEAAYPTVTVRAKDQIAMRQPHLYDELIKPSR